MRQLKHLRKLLKKGISEAAGEPKPKVFSEMPILKLMLILILRVKHGQNQTRVLWINVVAASRIDKVATPWINVVAALRM